VTILELLSILPKDDPDAVGVVRERLRAEGIELRERAEVGSVARDGNGIALALKGDGIDRRIAGSHLLVAAGRRANVDGLDLEAGRIEYGAAGIKVDARLRTSNRRVYAIGDVAGGPQFTHMAAHHAGVVIKNALFRLPAKVEDHVVPWVTYTDPELAHVGLTEARAKERGIAVDAVRWEFEDNDRAQAERETAGFAKAVVDRRGRIHGATIVGERAGELIQPWVLAIANGIKIGALAQFIAPYPTFGEASKRAAGAYYTPKLFSERTRKLVRLLMRFS
jgi:pyruvate/2-oxoglutarate dehydrogenase complex dihydrolipoamide dehydrogenase (E3) component